MDEEKLKRTQELLDQGLSYTEVYEQGGFYPSYISKLVNSGKLSRNIQNIKKVSNENGNTTVLITQENDDIEDIIFKVLKKIGVAPPQVNNEVAITTSLSFEYQSALEEIARLKEEVAILRQEKENFKNALEAYLK